MYKIINFFLVLLICSCGFYLKGTNIDYKQLPFNDWNIEDTGELKKYLRYELLKNNTIYVVNDTNNNVAILKLVYFNKVKQLQSINRLGIVDDYFLYLDVVVQVMCNGNNYGNPIKLRVNRDISFNNNNIIGKLAEEDEIWKELYQEVSEQIVNRIRYLNN